MAYIYIYNITQQIKARALTGLQAGRQAGAVAGKRQAEKGK